MDQRTIFWSRVGPAGTPYTVTEDDVTSSEGTVVERTSCDAIVDGAAGVTYWTVETNCVTESLEKQLNETHVVP